MTGLKARGHQIATLNGLQAAGFQGFTRISELDLQDVLQRPGVSAVVWDGAGRPTIAEQSVGGWFKGKDPSVDRFEAASRLIPDNQLTYLGHAASGSGSKPGLRARIKELRDFGLGKPVGHWGGRLIW